MRTIDSFMSDLTDEQLEAAFQENEAWRKTGVLEDGFLRNLYDEFCKESGIKSMIHLISEPLLYEMVLRYRKKLGK